MTFVSGSDGGQDKVRLPLSFSVDALYIFACGGIGVAISTLSCFFSVREQNAVEIRGAHCSVIVRNQYSFLLNEENGGVDKLEIRIAECEIFDDSLHGKCHVLIVCGLRIVGVPHPFAIYGNIGGIAGSMGNVPIEIDTAVGRVLHGIENTR